MSAGCDGSEASTLCSDVGVVSGTAAVSGVCSRAAAGTAWKQAVMRTQGIKERVVYATNVCLGRGWGGWGEGDK
jgi:hypothetical protein